MSEPRHRVELWYERWSIFNTWRTSVVKYGGRAVYEICAIRERHSVTALCYYGSNCMNCTDFSKLAEELVACKKIDKRVVPEIIKGIADNIAAMRAVDVLCFAQQRSEGKRTDYPIGKFYSYREFQPRLNEEFIAEFKSYNDFDVVELLLRYECLCPQGQQWAVPKMWLQEIKKLVGMDLIAFSSPINKGINARYCSGYPEDRSFGSSGSFFELSPTILDSYPTTFTMEVNPPFIERVLSDAVASVEKFMQYASEMKNPPRVTVLYVGPDWTDADFYRRIVEHLPTIKGVSLRMIKLFAGEYAYENATAGIKVTARQNSWLFTITNYTADEITLEGFKSIQAITPVAKYGGSNRYGRGKNSGRGSK